MNFNVLCEIADKQGFNVNLTSIFTIIGMAFCIIVALVALVWLTFFVIRLLVKTFNVQIKNSYEVFVEQNTAKANSKKQRNALKRQAKDARKMEVLNLKEESQDRIHQMKLGKLSEKLAKNEQRAKIKLGLESSAKTERPSKEKNAKVKVKEEVVKEEKIEVLPEQKLPVIEKSAPKTQDETPVVKKKRGRPPKSN